MLMHLITEKCIVIIFLQKILNGKLLLIIDSSLNFKNIILMIDSN